MPDNATFAAPTIESPEVSTGAPGRTDALDWSLASTWLAEVERSRRTADPYWSDWEISLNYYTGKSPDAADATATNLNYVNVNADFYYSCLLYTSPSPRD